MLSDTAAASFTVTHHRHHHQLSVPGKSPRQVSCQRLFVASLHHVRGPGSSVGIATDYGLDGPGSNPGGDENFRPSRPAPGPTQPPVKWVSGLSRG